MTAPNHPAPEKFVTTIMEVGGQDAMWELTVWDKIQGNEVQVPCFAGPTMYKNNQFISKTLQNVTLADLDLTHGSLSQSDVINVVFDQVIFAYTSCGGAKFRNVRFDRGSRLTDIVLIGVALEDVVFGENCTFTTVDFTGVERAERIRIDADGFAPVFHTSSTPFNSDSVISAAKTKAQSMGITGLTPFKLIKQAEADEEYNDEHHELDLFHPSWVEVDGSETFTLGTSMYVSNRGDGEYHLALCWKLDNSNDHDGQIRVEIEDIQKAGDERT